MPLPYRDISDTVRAQWDAGWPHADVPAYWRANDADPFPDPSTTPHFLRNEIEFGREQGIATGGGRFRNEIAQFGSVRMTIWTARDLLNEDEALDLLGDAAKVFRSTRTLTADGDLSFIGG